MMFGLTIPETSMRRQANLPTPGEKMNVFLFSVESQMSHLMKENTTQHF